MGNSTNDISWIYLATFSYIWQSNKITRDIQRYKSTNVYTLLAVVVYHLLGIEFCFINYVLDIDQNIIDKNQLNKERNNDSKSIHHAGFS